MKQIMTVFGFTFRDGIRKKAFIISTIIILLLIFVACLVPKGIAMFAGDDTEEETVNSVCYYMDEQRFIPTGSQAIQQAYPGTEVIQAKESKLDEYKEKVKKGDDQYIVLVNAKEGVPHIKVITKDFMATTDVAGIADALSKAYGSKLLGEKGYSQEEIAAAQMLLPYEAESAGDMNVSVYIISILLTLLMFFAIYYYGYGVAMSIATEKASRVMETLVVSAKPSRILLGKCLAMGALGLLQFAVMLGFGAACYSALVPEGTTIMGMPLDITGVGVKTFLLLALYFILGYALYAVMNSVCGALVSKIEDLNSTMMPVMLIAIASFYLGYVATAMSADNLVADVAMYVPFSSPFIMPFKLLNGQVGPTELILSVSIMVITITIITLVSIRIYSASVLHYGGRQKIIKLYKEKI